LTSVVVSTQTGSNRLWTRRAIVQRPGTDVTSFQVNGVRFDSDADAATPLIYVLRNDLRLKGARFGCGTGQCGACLVLVDGHPTPSCDTPLWAVEGRIIVTVEGLGRDARPHRVQEAFLVEQAGQCGYCLTGMLVSAAALLERDDSPDEGAVREALDRHLCRCGVQHRMVRAVLRAASAGGHGRR
jgi:nicotinate dehydrogenase subunit A